jgi:hypothetical protein
MAKAPPVRANTSPPPRPAREEPPDNRPAATFKYGVSGGIIEVAVWPKRMQGDRGEFTVYNVTFGRSYKDGDTWKTSDNVRGSDIPILLHALQQAYAFVLDDRANNGS